MGNMTVKQIHDELAVLIERGMGDVPVQTSCYEYNDEGYNHYTSEGTKVILGGTPKRPVVLIGDEKPDDDY